jgi:two-component system, chemotaxis family, sensor kinase CheA
VPERARGEQRWIDGGCEGGSLSEETPAAFEGDFLDDFFAECDEHLTHIRQALVLMEPSIGKAQVELAIVEDLFRDFHSLKGISAIVGLRAAEELAHGTEDYLRELTRGKVTLSAGGLDLLMSSAQRLEQIVRAFRAKEPIPNNAALLNDFREISGLTKEKETGSAKASTTSAPKTGAVSTVVSDEARARGLVLWKVTFSPSRELDEKGININSVRAKLSSAGEILKSVPQVRGEGVVVFEFLVGMKETPADITVWDAEGLEAELIEQAPPASAADALPISGGGPEVEPEHNPFLAPSHVVRVDLHRLDELMRIVGEMVIQRSRFEEQIGRSARERQKLDVQGLQEVNVGLARSLRELRDAVMRVRLVSVAEIFARMPFVVRDLARESRKKVRLALEGQQTEIDKYLIEQLKDPLLHLVRNSFSHGVETPEERKAAGKPEEATISLKASASGDSVILTVGDDGRGIDREAVFRRAREAGLTTAEKVDDAELLRILCSPGFSTREDADRTSGRGVGMAVVWNKVRELGGTMALESERQRGTKFIIRLPLTLAIADMLIVSAAAQTCAVPQSFVSEVLQVTEDQVRRVNGIEVIPYRSGVLPILRLASFFRLTPQAVPRLSVLVLSSDRGSSGLLVDRIHGQKEVVVRAIRDPLIQVPGVTGATELGDGRPVLILDGAALTSGAIRPHFQSPESN